MNQYDKVEVQNRTASQDRIGHNVVNTKSLRASVYDAMAYSAMVGLAETYFSALGIFLRASVIQIGILSALPPFVGALCQILSVRLLEFVKSRRRLIIYGASAQAITLLPISLLAFVSGHDLNTAGFLIVLVLFYNGALGITAPIWNSLIGDLVPANSLGRFFGIRNQKAGLATLIGMIFAGIILNYFEYVGLTAWGFFIIFILALISRFYSAYWLSYYEDPSYTTAPESFFTFFQFIRRARHSNFARFVFFFSSINFAVALSGPYFALYMLRDLKFPYLEFAIVTATVTVAQILTLKYWGKLVDIIGSKQILNICSIGVIINPLLWLFSTNVAYLISVQIFSGFVWAGFNLASSTFMFDSVKPNKRARCAAYQSIICAAFILIGSLSGAILSEYLPTKISISSWYWEPKSPLLFLFIISSSIRLFSASIFLSRFTEARQNTVKFSPKIIFEISDLTHIAGITFSLINGTLRKKKRQGTL